MNFEITIRQSDMIKVGNRQAPCHNSLEFAISTPIKDYSRMVESAMAVLASQLADTLLSSIPDFTAAADAVRQRLEAEIAAEAKQLTTGTTPPDPKPEEEKALAAVKAEEPEAKVIPPNDNPAQTPPVGLG